MRMSRLSAIAAGLLSIPASIAFGGPLAARPIVVELFTSEGCSSCPPADAVLTSLTGRGDVLPLAFHVTYWNSLGWRDPFSSEAATERQANYASRLGGGSYTPEIVVDGRRGVVGSDSGEVSSAIASSRGEDGGSPVIRIGRDGGKVSVSIGPGQSRGRVLLIGFDPRHVTEIGRGENSGRTLTESNIVRSMREIGTYDGTSLALTESRGAGQEVAILIQAPDGRIVGAAR